MIGLRYFRLERGFSQAGVGTLAGIPQSIVCLIETGRWNPTSQQLEALGKVLGVSPDVLLIEVAAPNTEAVTPNKQEEAVTR